MRTRKFVLAVMVSFYLIIVILFVAIAMTGGLYSIHML